MYERFGYKKYTHLDSWTVKIIVNGSLRAKNKDISTYCGNISRGTTTHGSCNRDTQLLLKNINFSHIVVLTLSSRAMVLSQSPNPTHFTPHTKKKNALFKAIISCTIFFFFFNNSTAKMRRNNPAFSGPLFSQRPLETPRRTLATQNLHLPLRKYHRS